MKMIKIEACFVCPFFDAFKEEDGLTKDIRCTHTKGPGRQLVCTFSVVDLIQYTTSPACPLDNACDCEENSMFEHITINVCPDCNDYLRFESYGPIAESFNHRYGSEGDMIYEEIDIAHHNKFQDRQVIYDEAIYKSDFSDKRCDMCERNLYGTRYLVNLSVRRNNE